MYDIFLLFFCGLLVVAAISDVRTFEIPNFVSLLGGGLFLPAAFLAQLDIISFSYHLLAAVLVLGVGLGLFAANLLGGGDVKVLSAAALWCGLSDLLPLLFWVAMAGGILAIILFLFRRAHLARWAEASPSLVNLHSQTGVPYAVAICVGALWVFAGNHWGW